MPIIPLLRQPGPLADAAKPVLDNQRRPTVNRGAEMNALGRLSDSFKATMVDADALTAPTRALGAVGQAIAQTGNVMGALALKKQEAETDIQVAEADNALSSAFGEHATWRASNPDPSGWKANLEQTLTKARKGIEANDKLHPAARQQIRLRADKFVNESIINTEQDSAQQTFRLAASVSRGGVTEDFANKRYDQGIARAEAAEAKGYLFPHEVAAYKADVIRYKEHDAREALQAENLMKAQQITVAQNLAVSRARNMGRDAALKDLNDGRIGGDLSPYDKERVRNNIDAVGRDMEANTMDTVSAGILSGELDSEDKLKANISPHLRPKVMAAALEMVRKVKLQEVRQEKLNNGVQNAVGLRMAIRDYDPVKDPDGSEYFALTTAIDSRAATEHEADLRAELKTKSGLVPDEAKTRPQIQKNVSATIDRIYDPYQGAIPWKRKEFDVQKGWIEVVDPKKQQEAIDAATLVELEMANWYKMNPGKVGDFEAVQEALGKAVPKGTESQAFDSLKLANPEPPQYRLDGTYQFRPVAGQGARGEAGPAGVEFSAPPSGTRVTSYAYDNDETPDSNSSAGIGAFVPTAEQERIKRGEPSPYRLKRGDFAVSPDVEKSLKDSGIQPMEEVEIQFSDGTTQTGRWMDRTSDSLTGRWDFYQGGKKGKHAKEGGKVTGFRRPD